MSKKENPKPTEKIVEQDTYVAVIEHASLAQRLAEPKYFNRVAKALHEKGKKGEDDFVKVAKEAGIPDDMAKQLYKAALSLEGWGW
jgi:hypothetical protein